MNLIKIFLSATLLMMAFTISGCQGNNSDPILDDNATNATDPVNPPIINLLEPRITISEDNVVGKIVKLTAFQNGQKLTSGTISVKYPTEITENGADGGTFSVDNIAVTNGEATFTFNGPSTIKAQSDLIFIFSYLENKETITKSLTVSYVPKIIPGSPIPSVILTSNTTEVTQNSQSVSIDVGVVDSNNNPFPTGEVKIVYPSDVKEGRDVGIFTQLSVPVKNGVSSFTYTAPKVLDANTSDLIFKFYHEELPSNSKIFTITINPDKNQTVSTSYKLTGSYLDGNITMNLESKKQIAFYLKDEQGTEVDESKITSISVTLLNTDLADLENIDGLKGDTITLDKSSASVYVISSTTSGIVPIKVIATFTDANSNIQVITEYLNVVIVSGPPTAMSINYVSTTNDEDNSQFQEKMIVSLTDKYSNKVNSNPGLSVALIAGYADDISGSMSYMYHKTGGVIDTADDKFKVAEGSVMQAVITNSGSGYRVPPVVSLSGGGSGFSAIANLSTYGSISAINILSGGSEYVSSPTVTAGGSGNGFSATATLSTTGTFFATATNSSEIAILTLDNKGQGYITVPTISATGGTGFDAIAVLEEKGSIKSLSIDDAGTDYEVGDVLPVGGDGSGGSVKVQTVDAGGGITGLVILDAGSGYTYATIDTLLASPKNDAVVSAVIGFSVKEIQLKNGGIGYNNDTLTVSGGGPTVAAQVSAQIGYSVSSVTVDNIGKGYRSALINFGGGKVDGSTSIDATATATITYPVSSIEITNPGKGYTNSALTLSAPSALKGVTASASAVVFASFNTVSDNGGVNDDFLMTFGDGYSFNASGKWDITKVNANDDFERVLKDQYDGNTTANLGFAIGNNYRQDTCLSGQEWVATAATPDAVFDSNGFAEVDISYNYYLAAKDVILSVNLVGAQNSTGNTVKLGEAIKHTLRGSELIADTLSMPSGLDHAIYRIYINLKGAVDTFRNSNFVYTVSTTSTGLTIHAVHDSMDDGIQNCPANNDEGRAYVEVEVSTTIPSTITLDNLVISREFK